MVIYPYPQPGGVTMKEKDLDAMLDELVKDRTPEEILGKSGLVKELTKRLVERVLVKCVRQNETPAGLRLARGWGFPSSWVEAVHAA